jgi:hypothetical protein
MSIVVDAKPMPYYCHGSKENSPGLRFGADGQFRITVFEDLHFGKGNKILVQAPRLTRSSADISCTWQRRGPAAKTMTGRPSES